MLNFGIFLHKTHLEVFEQLTPNDCLRVQTNEIHVCRLPEAEAEMSDLQQVLHLHKGHSASASASVHAVCMDFIHNNTKLNDNDVIILSSWPTCQLSSCRCVIGGEGE